MGNGLKQRIKQDRFENVLQKALLNLVVASDHLRSSIDGICEEAGITRGQYNVLRILRGVYPDGHPRGEIASRMLERAPDVTRIVDRLGKQGLAERDRSGEDRRLSITRITKKGLTLLDELEPGMKALFRDLGGRMSKTDCIELSRICEKVYGES